MQWLFKVYNNIDFSKLLLFAVHAIIAVIQTIQRKAGIKAKLASHRKSKFHLFAFIKILLNGYLSGVQTY